MSGLSAAPILPGSIGTTLLADDAVTTAKIAPNAVGRNEISPNEIAHEISIIDAGVIGSFVFARGGADKAYGDTAAGSTLRPTSALTRALFDMSKQVIRSFDEGASLSGTWRCLGRYDYQYEDTTTYASMFGATLWVRIS